MEVIPLLAVLFAVLALPIVGFRFAARRPNTSLVRRMVGACIGGLAAGGVFAGAAYLSDPELASSRYAFSFGFPALVAVVVALLLEGARRLAAWRSSERQ